MTATDIAPAEQTSAADRAALRAAVRDLLAQRCTIDDVRRAIDSDLGYDEKLWSQLTGEIGITGLGVPESEGGAGATFEEVTAVLEELGAALCPVPYLSTVLAIQALLAGTDADLRARHLPALAAGTRLGTVAVEMPVAGSLPSAAVVADGDRLTGEVAHVLDAAGARLFVVVARTGDTEAVYVVEPDGGGVTVTPTAATDQVRRFGRVEFAATPAARIGDADLADRLLDLAAVAVSAEQIGGAQAALSTALDYARVRTQFGRPIGSFQAVKHLCADLFLAIESGKAITRRAAREIATGGPETTVLASIAKAWCSDTYVAAAGDNLQIHGGVGFTWEHSAHLHLRRAKTDELLFGDARHHRARLADLLGI